MDPLFARMLGAGMWHEVETRTHDHQHGTAKALSQAVK
jgi:hypothetical protein